MPLPRKPLLHSHSFCNWRTESKGVRETAAFRDLMWPQNHSRSTLPENSAAFLTLQIPGLSVTYIPHSLLSLIGSLYFQFEFITPEGPYGGSQRFSKDHWENWPLQLRGKDQLSHEVSPWGDPRTGPLLDWKAFCVPSDRIPSEQSDLSEARPLRGTPYLGM